MRLRSSSFAAAIGLVVISAATALAEDWACSPWEWIHPAPEPLRLTAVTHAMGQFWGFSGDGIVRVSLDGATWKPIGRGANWWTSIEWTGTELLGTAGGQVLAGRDGVHWDVRLDMGPPDPFVYPYLNSLAYNGQTTVAVGAVRSHCVLCGVTTAWAVETSRDGTTWTAPELPAIGDLGNRFLSSVVWAKGAFVAVGSALLTSADGVTWIGNAAVSGSSVAANADVVVVSGDQGLFVSHDLVSWQHVPSPVEDGVVGVVDQLLYLAGRCSACPDREPSLWSSLDGVTWGRLTLDAPVPLRAFTSDGTRLLAVGQGAAISDDGYTWLTSRAQLAQKLNDVAHLGTTTVAVGEQGEVLTSTAGAPWRRVLWGGSARLREVVAGATGLVAVGDGVVLTSPGGVSWSPHESPGQADLTTVARLGSVYSAGGAGGALFFSSDGAHWNAANLTALGLNATGVQRVVANGSTFVAAISVGNGGGSALISSFDGRTWQTTQQLSARELQVVAGGGRFLAAFEDKVLGSADGMSWRQMASGLQLSRLTWVDGRFLALSYGVLTSSPDGGSWERAEGPSSDFDPIAASGEYLWQSPETTGLQRARCGTRGTVAHLPSLAHASGVKATRWRSDLEVHNPGTEAVTVGLEALNTSHPPVSLAFTLASGQSRRFDDVLGAELTENPSLDASATVRVSSWGGRALAAARTYNETADGTFGQLIPAFSEADADSSSDELRLIALSHAVDRSRGFRTNLGLGTAGGAAISVELWRSDHLLLRSFTVPLAGWRQLNDVLRLPGAGDVPDAFAVVRAVTPGDRVQAYASVVDNRTGDPMLVVPTAPIPEGQSAWLPGAGHISGVNGSVWQTDLELHNPGTTEVSCRVELLPWSEAVAAPLAVNVPVPAGQSVHVLDVVGARFAHEGGASLRLVPTGGTIMASARTFSGGAAGSVGQLLPALSADLAVTAGVPRRLIMLRQSDIRSFGYRSNLGLVNTSSVAATAEIELHDAAGRLLGTLTQPLRPLESVQITEVLRRLTVASVDDASAVIRTSTPGASLLAYACLIDNRTNDPLLITAQ